MVAVPSVNGKQLPNVSRGGTTESGAVEQPFAGQHSKTANLGSDTSSDTREEDGLGDVSIG